MLASLAVIFLIGLFLSIIFEKLYLPGLLGMLITGIVIGPQVFDLLDNSILLISPDLRQLALVIILTRAGLSIDVKDLFKAGYPALLMCFVPASCEIIGCLLLAPPLLGISYLEAAILGSVLAAVSPAVVAPRMLNLLETGYGTDKNIPQIILAGSSIDDIYVSVLFTSLVTIAQGGDFSLLALGRVPIAIVTGVTAGIGIGLILSWLFKYQEQRPREMRDSARVVLILGLSFLLLSVEKQIAAYVPFSGLLAIMSLGVCLLHKNSQLAQRLSAKYSKLWVAAEILLFVLVGAGVDISFVVKAGVMAILLVAGALVWRIIGVLLCLIRTKLSWRERLFCCLSYLPKATVQAAIGGIPLALGLDCGEIVLTVAVLSILITAPFGALAIDLSYKHLLNNNEN